MVPADCIKNLLHVKKVTLFIKYIYRFLNYCLLTDIERFIQKVYLLKHIVKKEFLQCCYSDNEEVFALAIVFAKLENYLYSSCLEITSPAIEKPEKISCFLK